MKSRSDPKAMKKPAVRKKPKSSAAAAGLRRRAEAQLKKRRARQRPAADAANSAADTRRLLHELEVHQVELETQNAELREARDRAEALSQRYAELYDFAPAGYCTISKKGLILEANLPAARLLGVARDALIGLPIIAFILPEDLNVYLHHRREVQSSSPESPPACELRLVKKDKSVFWARLVAAAAHAADGASVCRIALIDITQRKRVEQDLQETGEQLSFETMLSDISARLINLPADRIDSEIKHAQQLVCAHLGLDTSVLWQGLPEHPASLIATHVFLPPDFPVPVPDNMDGTEIFPWSLAMLFEGKIISIPLTDYPAAAARDLESLRYFGVKSALTFPLSAGGGPVFGGLNFDTIREEKVWSTGLIDKLKLVAQLFANALARKRADQALRESEARYRSIFEESIEGIFRTTVKGRLLVANPALARILGYASAEDLRSSVTDVATQVWANPEERSRFAREVDRRGTIRNYECQFQRRDGSKIWVSLSTRPVRGPGGQVAFYEGSVVDIDARKLAQMALEESEARYREIFEGSPVGIYRATLEGKVIFANSSVARILGYDSAEEFMASVTDLGEDVWPSQEERSRFIQKLDEQGNARGYECRLKRKDGSLVWVMFNTHAFRRPDGRLAYGDGFVEDISERKRAEEALAKSQKLLAETEKIGKVGGWEIDLDTMKLTWTPEVYAIHEVDPGYVPTVEQAIQFYSTATRPVIEEAVRRAIEDGEPYDVELELITAKGHLRSVHSIGIADPERRRVYGFFQDITESKKAEAALKESEERFRALADSSLVGIYILQDGKYVYVNPAMAGVFGYSVAEMTGMTPREIVQAEDHGMVGENIRRRISGEVKAIRYEVKGRYRDGSTRDVEVYGTGMEINGRPALVGTLIDITDHKKAEEALAESEKRYRMLFESAPAGIILIGTDGRVQAANSLQAKMYGYDSPQELEGFYATLFVAEKDRERAARNMKDVLQGDEVPDRTYTAVRRDGSEFPVEVTSITLRGPGEEVQGYLCLTRDITKSQQDETERIQLRQELTHLARVMAMSELSTSLAHEINQPLGAILNNAETIRILLSQPRAKQEDLPEIVEDIIQDAKRAGDVIRKVRGVVKRGDVHLERLQVNALIDEVLALVRNSLIVNNVTLRLDLSRHLADIPGDRVRLQQVLLNLMTNALDAMKEAPERTLTVRSAMDGPDRVIVSVGDSGRGIPEAERAEVFRPFFTTKKDGLGLGLPVCRSIIEEHGGRIWADNNPGGGAVFAFSLKALKKDGT